jgi:cobalamin biosynthesis protein CobD/CbiB
MGDEGNNPVSATAQRPRWLLAAFVTPVAIIGTAVALVRHFQNRPDHPYTGLGIVLFGAAAAVLFATMFLIWGWKDGERPRWIGILGVCVSLYLLKTLLFAS